jgi:hypothetical protein
MFTIICSQHKSDGDVTGNWYDFRVENFSSDEEVKAAIRLSFLEKENCFEDGIQKLFKIWQKCIEFEGDYVER